MSAIVEQSASPWKKRPQEDLDVDKQEAKRPRRYYFRLASESSRTSDDEAESVWSLQGKETDFVADTSDTDSRASTADEYEFEFEYEVASLSENDNNDISTTDSEGMMIAAAAAVICNSALEGSFVTVTDVEEESDNSVDNETASSLTDFSTCVQCKGENRNRFYRYCRKCFQDRKNFLPPRPRRNKKKKSPVNLNLLQNCLDGLSQNTGSQECPPLGLDLIYIPEHLRATGTSSASSTGNSLQESAVSSSSNYKLAITSTSKVFSCDQTSKMSHKRRLSNSGSSESEPPYKKPLLATETETESEPNEPTESDPEPIASSDHRQQQAPTRKVLEGSSSSDTDVTRPNLDEVSRPGSFSSESSGFFSEPLSETSGGDPEKELCRFCHNAPKNGVFVHSRIAHCCCCYSCAKKTLRAIRRCPICNRKVNQVLRLYTV